MSSDVTPSAAKYPSDGHYGGGDDVTSPLAFLFFFLFFVLLFVLCICCFCRWCILQRRRRRSRAAALISILSGDADVQHRELETDAGLESSVIASLPTFKYHKRRSSSRSSDGPGTALECAICLSATEDGEVGRLLPNCGHVFHVECIDKWLGVNSTCPVCRRKAVPAAEAAAAPDTARASLGGRDAMSSGTRNPPGELRDGGDASDQSERANAEGAAMTKEIGSTSRLASSCRKMAESDWSGRRSSAPGVGEDDVERRH